jgi:magnesium transporter
MSDAATKPSDAGALAARLVKERPEDIVEALNHMRARDAARVLLALPEPLAVETLDEPQLAHNAAILSELARDKAATLIKAIFTDRAAHIVRELRVSTRNEILAHISPDTKAELDRLLRYPEDCAGAIMTTEFVSASADWTVGQTLERIKAVELTRETIYSVFILDAQTGALLRAAPLRRLITSDPQKKVIDAPPTASR